MHITCHTRMCESKQGGCDAPAPHHTTPYNATPHGMLPHSTPTPVATPAPPALQVNCTSERGLFNKYKVQHFPTMKLFRGAELAAEYPSFWERNM